MAPCLVDLVAIYLSVVQFPKNISFTNAVVVSVFLHHCVCHDIILFTHVAIIEQFNSLKYSLLMGLPELIVLIKMCLSFFLL